MIANQFPRAGFEPATYGSEIARSTDWATAPHELMAIIAAGEFEDAEWVDEDLAGLAGLDVPVETVNVINTLPIMSMLTHLANPWTTE